MKKILLFVSMFAMAASAAFAADWANIDKLAVIGDVEKGWSLDNDYEPNMFVLNKDAENANLYVGQGVILHAKDGVKMIYKTDGSWNYDTGLRAINHGDEFEVGTPIDAQEYSGDDHKFFNKYNSSVFKVTVDVEAMTITFDEPDEIYLVGSGCAAGWNFNTDIAVKNEGNNTFVVKARLYNGEFGNQIKFLADHSWASSIVSATDANVNLPLNSDKLAVGYSNDIQWCVPQDNYPCKIVVALPLEGEQYLQIYPCYEHVTMVGNFGGDYQWNTNPGEKYELTEIEDNVWQWVGELTEGTEFKFLVDAYDWGSYELRATEPNQSVDAVVAGGEKLFYQYENNVDDKWKVNTTATYRITVYAADRQYTFETVTDMPSSISDAMVDTNAAVYYNLQGIRVNNPSNGIFIKVQGNKSTKVIR